MPPFLTAPFQSVLRNIPGISMYLDRELLEHLKAYADAKGQTMTTAIERILKEHLDKYDEALSSK